MSKFKVLSRIISMRYASLGLWNKWIAIGAKKEELDKVFKQIKGDLDSWYINWYNYAENYEKHAQSGGDPKSNYIAAFVYYYIAQYPLFEICEKKQNAYRKLVECYQLAGKHFEVPPQRFEVKFDGVDFPSYLRVPNNDENVPLVLIVHGIESSKEELYKLENELLKQGLATLTFDGPGQGESLILRSYHANQNFVKCTLNIFNFIKKNILPKSKKSGVIGISFGGTTACKLAMTDNLFDACVDFGGFYDISTCYSKYPLPGRLRIQKCFGLEERKKIEQMLYEFSLEHYSDKKIECPFLVIYGKKDRFVRYAQKEQIFKMAVGEKEMKIYEDGDHSCSDYLIEIRENIALWMKRKLK